MHDILTRQFLSIMEEYSAAQQKHKQDVKNRAKRVLTSLLRGTPVLMLPPFKPSRA